MSSSAVIELVQTSRASRTAGGAGGVDKQPGGPDKNRIAGNNAGTKEGAGEDWEMVDQSIKQLLSADGVPFYRDYSAVPAVPAVAVPAVPDCDWPTE